MPFRSLKKSCQDEDRPHSLVHGLFQSASQPAMKVKFPPEQSLQGKNSSGVLYALSNNHVYALEKPMLRLAAEVLQPGRYDGGNSSG